MVDRSLFALAFVLLLLPLNASGQAANPFDVIHPGDIDTPEFIPEEVDTTTLVPRESLETETIYEEIDEAISSFSENIFDVDHIPLKNSDEHKSSEKPSVERPDLKEKSSTEKDKTTVAPSVDPPVKERISPESPAMRERGRNLIFVVLLITLLILTVVINIKRKTFFNLYRSIFNDNYLNLVQREENNGNSIFFLLLYTAFFLNSSLFVYLSFPEHSMTSIPMLTIFLGIFGIYVVRHLTMRITAAVFTFQKAALQFNFTIIVFNCIIGMILFPLNAFYAYSPLSKYMFFLGISMFIFFYLIRQLRGFFLAMRIPRLNLFHFFIYLCTCEIAPFLIIYKFIKDYNSAI